MSYKIPKKQVKNNSESKLDPSINVRSPRSLPRAVHWMTEGDQLYYDKLLSTDQEAAVWFASWLESEFGNNGDNFGYNRTDYLKRRKAMGANERDVMQASRIESLEDPGLPLAGHLAYHGDKTKLALRSKQHIDSCQQDTYTNHIENSLIDLIDTTLPQAVPKSPKKRKS